MRIREGIVYLWVNQEFTGDLFLICAVFPVLVSRMVDLKFDNSNAIWAAILALFLINDISAENK